MTFGLKITAIGVPVIAQPFTFTLGRAILDPVRAGQRFRLGVAGIVVPEVILTFTGSLGCAILDAIGTSFCLGLRVTGVAIPIMPVVDAICLR